jgi:uncharacterized protein
MLVSGEAWSRRIRSDWRPKSLNGRVNKLAIFQNKAKETYCVFNKTRESFLSLNVTVADTHFARLRGLLGRVRLKADEGIWVIPSQGVHSMGLLFATDLVYLDSSHRVIHLVESFGTFRIASLRLRAASVLQLHTRTIYSSQTQVGDQLLICTAKEMEQYLPTSRPKASAKSGSA